MRTYRHFQEISADHEGAVVAIGNFDGVHRGHREVIATAERLAAEFTAPWGVLTFEPHPRQFFNPDLESFRLTPFHLKARLIESLGADFLVVLAFDAEFSKRSAENFVDEILIGGLAARHVVAGLGFVFGHSRKGTFDFLTDHGAGWFGTTSVAEVRDETGEVISSTRVRKCLADGDPAGAAALLGRPFEIEGRVVSGDARGRQIGFPTANVNLGEGLCPVLGVYAVRAGLEGENGTVWHDGVANLGYRPTFGGEDVVLETHVFDFEGDLVGRHLRVALVDFLRPERKFAGVDELKSQIARDCEDARARLGAAPAQPAEGNRNPGAN